MRIAHFGGFDAANYGDSLFPLIFARRLARHADIVHVSPTGNASPWTDGAGSVSLDMLERSSLDIGAVVIGGGNLIYTGTTPLPGYDDGSLGANLAYPALWLGAAEMAAKLQVPLVWNAPGVRRAFSSTGAALVSFAASVSELITVREASSQEFLHAAGVNAVIECVVDSGIEVAELWSVSELDEAYRTLFFSRGMDIPDRTVAIHINDRYVTEPLISLARRLDRISRSLDATPLLLALGPCHADDVLQRKLAELMATKPVLVNVGARLVDFVSCIAKSRAFAGSSLHGMITACAFDKPAVVVAVERHLGFQKFSGFLGHVGDTGQLCRTWAEAEERLPLYAMEKNTLWPRLNEARARSAAHWERLIETCMTPLSLARCNEKVLELRRFRKHLASQNKRLGIAAGALVDQARDATLLIREKRAHGRPDIVMYSQPSVEIIVCVHNALDDVRACFESLLHTTLVSFRVLVVNDASDAVTSNYLRTFTNGRPGWSLHENAVAQRYTRAANQALTTSTADYVILLNSDTIVPSNWLSKLIACGESSDRIGLIGPLSNAAAWQSIPVIHAPDGDWMINELPDGMSVDSMASLVDALAVKASPHVQMLNGFCMAIKRPVLDAIGYLDCELSPYGYAEEIDFCFRAADAGYAMVIDDSAYVYHAKSKSYGHEMRRELALGGKQRLQERYGKYRLDTARSSLRDNEVLAMLRRRLSAVVDALQALDDTWANAQPDVLGKR